MEACVPVDELREGHPMSEGDFEVYLERYAELERRGGRRKQLDRERFDELQAEHSRLVARMDPDDIQLDEWKRVEELRFLLILEEDEEEE